YPGKEVGQAFQPDLQCLSFVRGNGVINEAGCWNYLVGMTLGAIHVSQVPESGWPRPLPREWVASCAALDPDLDPDPDPPPSSSYPLHRVQDIGDHPRFPCTREWVALSAPPTDWLQLANQPQTEAEVAALRCRVNRGRPFGDPNWIWWLSPFHLCHLSTSVTFPPPGRLRRRRASGCGWYHIMIQWRWKR